MFDERLYGGGWVVGPGGAIGGGITSTEPPTENERTSTPTSPVTVARAISETETCKARTKADQTAPEWVRNYDWSGMKQATYSATVWRSVGTVAPSGIECDFNSSQSCSNRNLS
jgi:hypothetical protein